MNCKVCKTDKVFLGIRAADYTYPKPLFTISFHCENEHDWIEKDTSMETQ